MVSKYRNMLQVGLIQIETLVSLSVGFEILVCELYSDAPGGRRVRQTYTCLYDIND